MTDLRLAWFVLGIAGGIFIGGILIIVFIKKIDDFLVKQIDDFLTWLFNKLNW